MIAVMLNKFLSRMTEPWERETKILCKYCGIKVWSASTTMYTPPPAQTVLIKKTGTCKSCSREYREFDKFIHECYIEENGEYLGLDSTGRDFSGEGFWE